MIDPTIVLVFLAILAGGIISILAGTGLGIVMLIALSFFFDIRTTIVTMAILGLFIQGNKMIHFYKWTDWETVKYFVVSGIPASFVGGYLLYIIPSRIVEICLGLLCLAFVLVRVFKWMPNIKPTREKLITFGAISGIMSGAIGNSNLIRNPILLALGFKKEAFIGTSCVIALLTALGRLVSYMQNFVWSEEIVFMMVVCTVAIFIGMHIGKKLLKYVSHTLFERLLLATIVVGAIKLLLF